MAFTYKINLEAQGPARRWYYDKLTRSVVEVEVKWEARWHATITDGKTSRTIPVGDLISPELAQLLITENQATHRHNILW